MATQSGPKVKSKSSQLAAGAKGRYVDAYRVAGTINVFGQAIKIAGFIFAAVIFIGVANSLKSPGAGLVAASIIAAFFFVIGIIVAAQGQMLKAAVDTAVNSSPFLDNNQKAATMSLPGSIPSYGPAEDLAGARELDAAEEEVRVSDDEVVAPFCYHCGAELTAEARVCTACGKQL
jgi:hypothetical protein